MSEIVIHVTSSLLGNTPFTINYTLQDVVSEYSHTVTMTGGYESASFSFAASRDEMDVWLLNGLGCHVHVLNEALETVWEGFVNEIEASYGPLAVRVGPLTEVVNRAFMIYSNADTGDQTTTSTVEDTLSRERWGLWYKAFSGSKMTTANAMRALQVLVNDRAWPTCTHTVGEGRMPGLRVSCKGYKEMLDYPYVAPEGSITVRQKIVDIIAQEPGYIVSRDDSRIAANSIVVPRLDNQGRSGLDVIKGLAELGGSEWEYDRYAWGVFAGRLFEYRPVGSPHDDLRYMLYLHHDTPQVRNVGGAAVLPSSVLPGYWLRIADLMLTLDYVQVYETVRRDLRYMLIESVTYTAPHKLRLQGGRTDRLPQLLAYEYMLGGM